MHWRNQLHSAPFRTLCCVPRSGLECPSSSSGALSHRMGPGHLRHVTTHTSRTTRMNEHTNSCRDSQVGHYPRVQLRPGTAMLSYWRRRGAETANHASLCADPSTTSAKFCLRGWRFRGSSGGTFRSRRSHGPHSRGMKTI